MHSLFSFYFIFTDAVVPLGRVHVNSLGELRPLVTTQSHTHSTNKPSLNDLESESGIVCYCNILSQRSPQVAINNYFNIIHSR